MYIYNHFFQSCEKLAIKLVIILSVFQSCENFDQLNNHPFSLVKKMDQYDDHPFSVSVFWKICD
jgi:hypothetical protein